MIDGQVEVIDAAGNVVPTASDVVTFSVTADLGAGYLQGTANGDPSCLVNNLSPSRPAFHGLVLGVVAIGDAPGLVCGPMWEWGVGWLVAGGRGVWCGVCGGSGQGCVVCGVWWLGAGVCVCVHRGEPMGVRVVVCVVGPVGGAAVTPPVGFPA